MNEGKAVWYEPVMFNATVIFGGLYGFLVLYRRDNCGGGEDNPLVLNSDNI
jgi:hypothetical protein